MRILVLSDVHANLTALESVIQDAGVVDAVWCLGDIVGYGPDPNECVDRIQFLPGLQCIIGNHDAAVMEQINIDAFNPEAQHVIRWTKDTLTDSSALFLQRLPERIILMDVTLVHGSPRQPVWEYILDPHTATRSFDFFETAFCFVGHTHLPVHYQLSGNHHAAALTNPGNGVPFELAPRAILNPGSVGQPRDRDPRAAYGIFYPQSNKWEYHRVAYEINSVQLRMEHANLPDRHIQRLSSGW